jgi:hypothetical protein
MLTLEVYDDVVFAHYCPNDAGPNVGGYLGRVYPGGIFLGATWDQLQSLGNGTHDVILDERARGPNFTDEYRGKEPRESYLTDGGWAHFCHTVGSITRLELQNKLDIINGVKTEGKTFTLGSINKNRLESWLLDIHINSFVRRQTAESAFSYWTCSDEELLRRIRKGWENHKPGYRDGVVLVPIDPEGCFSGVVELKAGDKLVGEYTARKDNEEPRKHTYAANGEKMPAKYCYIVLYRHDVLAEGKENETDKEWEMVSFNASPTEEDPPIVPGTLIANHFQLSGGTATNMTDSEFVKALRESVMFWKNKAMVAPKQ